MAEKIYVRAPTFYRPGHIIGFKSGMGCT